MYVGNVVTIVDYTFDVIVAMLYHELIKRINYASHPIKRFYATLSGLI